MVAAAFAMLVANSPLAPDYFDTLHIQLGPLSALHWINDGLMALFFLLVGLEIKREVTDGHLSAPADRTLPVLAAIAGMAVPAVIYLAMVAGQPELHRGWAIPAATDIAFAIGIVSLLGARVPASLKLLLTTIAIVDDMGAVAIIAIGYTDAISGQWLLAALAVMAGLAALNRASVRHPGAYLAGFALLWFTILQSGVHATVAGVLAALFVPGRKSSAGPSPLLRLEHGLQKPVALFIVPLFGFANAGVSLAGADLGGPLPMGIATGLFLGKQIGIFGAIWLAVRFGLAARPSGASWPQVYGLALLCGIGFTMSLFIGDLAFADPAHDDGVKIGVLLGSVASALAGGLLLSRARGAKKEAD